MPLFAVPRDLRFLANLVEQFASPLYYMQMRARDDDDFPADFCGVRIGEVRTV